MKHFGCSSDYNDERNADLMRAYRQQIVGRKEIVLADVFRSLVEMPSKRFWVSEERARIVIGKLHQGDDLSDMRPNKREMFKEIYKRTLLVKAEHPGMSIGEAVYKVVHSPAPKFYLTPQSARVIFFKVKKQWYKKRMPRALHS